MQTTATAVSRSGSSDHSPVPQPSPPALGTPAAFLPALPPPCREPGPRPRTRPPPSSRGHRQPPGTHHSSSVGMLLSGGHRQYTCGRPCRTRRTAAACRGPACPRTGGRRTCGTASARRPCSACRRARSSLDTGGWGQLGQDPATPGALPAHCRGAGSELTSCRVFYHGVPLARALNLENLVHKDDPTVVERIVPARDGPLGHPTGPALPKRPRRLRHVNTVLRACEQLRL